MARQAGPCAFSNACNIPGERVRIGTTNRYCCPLHGAQMSLATPAVESTTAPVFHAPSGEAQGGVRFRRQGWATYAGIATGGF